MSAERLQILQLLEDGQITAAEALARLAALPPEEPQQTIIPPPPSPQRPKSPPRATPSEFTYWRNWWLIPLWIGVSILVVGAGLMYWAYSASGFGLGFVCAALPFALGVLVMALAAASRTAKWLHVRVKNPRGNGPRNIALSFPLPVGPLAWVLKRFGRHLPGLAHTSVDELILSLDEATSADNPFYVAVQDGANGEQVEVYIG